MKTPLSLIFTILLLFSCTDNFNIENPDVKQFVMQLKNGTYNQYVYTEDGSKLWTIMPEFSKNDIPKLLQLAGDTTLVSPCDHFPTNPISSIPPYRTKINNEGEGIMIGEYLLWCVESIINKGKFISLTPLLVKIVNEQPMFLTAKEVLMVREYYVTWWEKYGKNETYEVYPLTGKGYYWR